MASAAEVLHGPPPVANPGLIVAAHSSASHEQGNTAANSAGAAALDRPRRYWPAIEWLPVQISISLPIPRFRVRDLLALDPGQIISTDWPNGDDLPLSVDQVQLAWVEMESVEQEMAVRITRLL
jgi:flagellar motor switch/type III secretory pathway protein FliN